jgi:hypothetical protein
VGQGFKVDRSSGRTGDLVPHAGFGRRHFPEGVQMKILFRILESQDDPYVVKLSFQAELKGKA